MNQNEHGTAGQTVKPKQPRRFGSQGTSVDAAVDAVSCPPLEDKLHEDGLPKLLSDSPQPRGGVQLPIRVERCEAC